MKVTILCSLVLMAAVQEHPERFPRARALGWKLLVLCALAYVGAFFYAGWDGIREHFGFNRKEQLTRICTQF